MDGHPGMWLVWRFVDMDQPESTKSWVIMLIACLAQYCIPVMVTAVAVILPAIGRELHASALELGLVEQTYVVATAVSMLFFGRLGDILGWRRLYITGFFCFSLATGCLGLAENIQTLIVMRAVQGLAAATILSGSIALVAMAYPPQTRGRKIGLIQAFTYGGLASGPLLGGLVASILGWRFVFWLFVPVGLAAGLLCLIRLRPPRPSGRTEPVDWPGSLLYAAGIALLAAGAAHVSQWILGVPAMLLGAVALLCFGRLETHTAHPLLDVRLLSGNRTFTLSCLAAMGNYASTFGLTFLMSLDLQYVLGLSPSRAGLILLVMPLTQMLASPLAGRLSEKVPPIQLATLGMVITCLGLVATALTAGGDTPLLLLAAELVVVGAGYGIFITPNVVVVMGSVDSSRYGLASGMVGTMRTLGMVLSMTAITVVLSLGMGGQAVTPGSLPAFLGCMHVGLGILAVFSLLGIMTSSRRMAAGEAGPLATPAVKAGGRP
jgi:EmrB/QacA subfamily drug resistance transporter